VAFASTYSRQVARRWVAKTHAPLDTLDTPRLQRLPKYRNVNLSGQLLNRDLMQGALTAFKGCNVG
jgi:hypothetical protein